MERRSFLNMGGLALGGLLLPPFGRAIAAEELLKPVAVQFKKMLADTAMGAATQAGATYCDVRIGRYLNQFITTRDLNIENVTNTESAGVGVRVIAGGAYGFAATNDMSPDGVAAAARQAVAIAKANSKLQTEPVQLAPTPGVGEVAWATPIKKDWRLVPIKEKAELLIAANKAGMEGGASFMQSLLFQVNQQKYFASTDGSTSTRTSTVCGCRCSPPPSITPPTNSVRARACRRRSAWAMNTWMRGPRTRSRRPAACARCTSIPMT